MSDQPSGKSPDLNIAAIVQTLNRHKVAYVVIGGVKDLAVLPTLEEALRRRGRNHAPEA